jgi:hypothetical protein
MKSISDVRKSRGRPRIAPTPVTVRLTPDQLAALDAHIAKLKEPVGRPEAIRRLVEKGLEKR